MQKTLIKNDPNDFQVIFTKPLIKASTIEYRTELVSKLRKSMLLFPELHPKIIKFGLRTGATAIAYTNGFRENQDFMLIGINPIEKLYYYILGHELTHFVQRITKFPGGEKQCDVWTLARDELFTDRPPHYIDIPSVIRKDWDTYKLEVRKLCIEAIEIRNKKRCYIAWLEEKIAEKISE